MKKLFTALILLIPLSAVAQLRPASVPAAPDAATKVADYTAEDVIGLFCSAELPDGHPFKHPEGKKYDSLKADWPGANQEASAEKLFKIVAKSEQGGLGENAVTILNEATTLTVKQKVDAFLKVFGELVDNAEKDRLLSSIYYLFDYTPDVRLLDLLKGQLEDAAVARELYMAEGEEKVKFTRRGDAKSLLETLLLESLKIENFNEENYDTQNEASDCLALQQWMDTNANVIAAKCLQFASNPERKKRSLSVQTWSNH